MKVIHSARKHPVISSFLGALGTLIVVWLIGLGLTFFAITGKCPPDDVVCDGPAMLAISIIYIFFFGGMLAALIAMLVLLYFLLLFNEMEDDEG